VRALQPLALSVAWAALIHCGPRVVDAVDLPATGDGGPGFTWPNTTSSANSDPWIVAHHDSIVQMNPRVLLLDFYNPWLVAQAQALAENRITTLAESSRYHGYSDPNAAPFVNYDLVSVIDLTDKPPPATWQFESSTKYPVDSTGAFDMSALFSSSFAAYFNVPDPTNPSGDLTLCQLFEQGIINELWIVAGDESNTIRKAPLTAESKQVYDAQSNAIAGTFNPDTGYQAFTAPACKVTARIATLSPTHNVDCDLVARWAGIENTHIAIPYLDTNADDFFNDDFIQRDNAPFNSWADLVAISPATALSWQYPTATSVSGVMPNGAAWTMNPFLQGCGTAHFPPNAREEWDYANAQEVQSRCEHYGMHDGLGGGDVTNAYSTAVVSAYTQEFMNGGCGAGWQIYLPQSMPGLNNQAVAADGTPMKNWWPFLFY
jgi:hypothetical protein